MKKFLLGTVALLALAAPASAADLGAYKAPPPMIAMVYDWTVSSSTRSLGFEPQVLGPGNRGRRSLGLKVATMRPAALPAARSAIAGSPAPGCSASKDRATGADLKGSNFSALFPGTNLFTNELKINAFGLFTGQIGWAANNVLFYVKGGAAVTNDHFRVTFTPTGDASYQQL